MQHLKLTIPNLNQTFLHKGNFIDLNYNQLVLFASTKIPIPQSSHYYFQYDQENFQIKINNQETLQQLKDITIGQPVLKLSFYLIEKQPQLHQVTCSQCGLTPIPHVWYQCFVCQHLVFCPKCLEHAELHPLIMFTTPGQERFTNGLFKKSVQSVAELFTKSMMCSKNKILEFKEMINRKRVEFQKQKQDQHVEKLFNEQEKFNLKLLTLSELFEKEPLCFTEFVKENDKLEMEELIEEASIKFG